MERTLADLFVEGVKTRKKPSKHIVFAVKVTWSDGQVNVVSRQYREFFELMEQLNETFPVEAGKHEHKKRILPNLHAKKTFLVSSSVMKQLERITHFTKELINLPDYIYKCDIVRNFFTPSEEDIEFTRRISIQKPKTKSRNQRRKSVAKILSISGPVSLEQYLVIADVSDECNTGLDLKEGNRVEVIEKLETGWWLVTVDGEQGWVPASYLSNEDDPDETMTTIKYPAGQGECYVSSKSYASTCEDELSFNIGVNLQVIEKNLDGWWRAIYNGCEGLVPAAYLKKIGERKSKHGNKEPTVRKVPSQGRYSVSPPQGEMTDETLAKLRMSTFKSPEEKEEPGMIPKRKLGVVKSGKVPVEMKTSVGGGWVPPVKPAAPPHFDEDEDSSDEDICTLEDFINEEKESKDSRYYDENLPDNEREMSRESDFSDRGMERSPSSPVTMEIPDTAAANNMYVVLANYLGLKEEGDVDLFEGQQVRVLEKTDGGWWLVENEAKQRGWAPSNFLKFKTN